MSSPHHSTANPFLYRASQASKPIEPYTVRIPSTRRFQRYNRLHDVSFPGGPTAEFSSQGIYSRRGTFSSITSMATFSEGVGTFLEGVGTFLAVVDTFPGVVASKPIEPYTVSILSTRRFQRCKPFLATSISHGAIDHSSSFFRGLPVECY